MESRIVAIGPMVNLDLDGVMPLNRMVGLEPYEWLMVARPRCSSDLRIARAQSLGQGRSGGGSRRGGGQPYESFIWFKANHTIQGHYTIKVKVNHGPNHHYPRCI